MYLLTHEIQVECVDHIAIRANIYIWAISSWVLLRITLLLSESIALLIIICHEDYYSMAIINKFIVPLPDFKIVFFLKKNSPLFYTVNNEWYVVIDIYYLAIDWSLVYLFCQNARYYRPYTCTILVHTYIYSRKLFRMLFILLTRFGRLKYLTWVCDWEMGNCKLVRFSSLFTNSSFAESRGEWMLFIQFMTLLSQFTHCMYIVTL